MTAKIEPRDMSLKAARINAGYSQEELADLLGLSAKTISYWETGKVKIKPINLYGIAYICKLNADLIRA
ncbi:MAG: helix-turn-helix transcriptional regulator [Liquorilactobacillus hordei]|uniref:helix-turn-helix domain-containing protein n=1 Tax=Liquorilactobacillus TaxID=2767888 RepID=UPI0039EB1898